MSVEGESRTEPVGTPAARKSWEGGGQEEQQSRQKRSQPGVLFQEDK